jgi:hypothetical protein
MLYVVCLFNIFTYNKCVFYTIPEKVAQLRRTLQTAQAAQHPHHPHIHTHGHIHGIYGAHGHGYTAYNAYGAKRRNSNDASMANKDTARVKVIGLVCSMYHNNRHSYTD